MVPLKVRSSLSIINLLCILLLASCVGAPISDAEPEGALLCQAPLSRDEAVVLKGDDCLAEILMDSPSSPLLLTDSDVRSVSIPWVDEIDKIKEGHTFTPQDTNLPVLEFLRRAATRDAIKEYNIRYIIYSTANTYYEPRPEPYSLEDWKGAIYYSREKSSYISVLIIDAQDPQVIGSLHQRSEGRIRIIPLLVVISTPDTERSACQKMAEVILDLLLGDCTVFQPQK